MQLVLLGVSHHTAPVDLRERIDFSRHDLGLALAELARRPGTAEALLLSTCNRVEIYAAAADPAAAARELAAFLSEFHRVPPEELARHFYQLVDRDAAAHLFRVAAGLDSLVVGEPQILGQVKDAFAAAAERQCTGTLLNRLFHASFAVGKRVRSETGLSEGAVSVSYAAISLARKIFGDLRELQVLVLGAGEMAKLTAIHLRAQHVRRLAIASRTPAHAEALAERLGGTALPWTGLHGAVAEADIVITATGADEPVLHRHDIERIMRARRSRPLFLIDIAVPRDVEAATADLDQVFLYNIDDLRAIVSDNLAKRAAELACAEAIVAEEVERFTGWLRARGAVPTVVALRQRFEAIRQAELQRLAPRMAALPPEARARIEEITRLIVEKLLLAPTEQLKAAADEATILADADALSRLFSLTIDPDAGPPAGAAEHEVPPGASVTS